MTDYRFQQGSAEWLELRKKKIGASEASIIMGISPYKTSLQLWREKTGRTIPSQPNASMLRGIEMEDELRQAYCNEIDELFLPRVVFHPEYSFMMASLDGVTMDGRKILEVKTCNKDVFGKAMSGEVAPHYYAQVQHQLSCVPEALEVHYHCFHKGSSATVIVNRNESYIEDMIEQEKIFYDCVINDVPPKSSDRDYVFRNDSEFEIATLNWLDSKKRLSQAEEHERACKADLLSLVDTSCYNDKVRISKCERKDVDYRKAVSDYEIDLSAYKKEPKEYFKLTIIDIE